jgi:uncharacterized membrane protein YhaH (DUF805 family)
MMSWVMVPLRRYAEFEGRSSRAEFWKWTLVFYAVILLLIALMFLGRSIIPGSMAIFGALAAIVFLGGILPMLAIQVRRLHDTGRSGYWLLGSIGLNFVDNAFSRVAEMAGGFVLPMIFSLISLIYSIVLLVFYCLPGNPEENDYGPNPYADTDLEALAEQFH